VTSNEAMRERLRQRPTFTPDTANLVRIQPVPPEHPEAGAYVGRFAAAIVGLAVTSWLLMLGFGAVHSVWPSVPTVGYWTALGLAVGAQAVAAIVRRPPWKWARS
jgi:integral membrane sensor domain MASE1